MEDLEARLMKELSRKLVAVSDMVSSAFGALNVKIHGDESRLCPR
ncbi:hypothetical protein [Shimazuella soli]|nr:hypothetical protein [Shimazuella soli]